MRASRQEKSRKRQRTRGIEPADSLAVVITNERVERRIAESDARVADRAIMDIAALYSSGITFEKVAAARMRKEALRINDEVVQSLVAALWALELDDREKANEMLRAALAGSRGIVDGLLSDLDQGGQLLPGSLRSIPRSER